MISWNKFKLPAKEDLANRLVNHPTLNSLLCLLLYEPWFRLAFLGALLFMPAFALFVLKLWTPAPPDFLPRFKISGLDLVQAWSLKRTALKQMNGGHYEDAFYSWRMAVANNPGDPELLRGFLQNILQSNDTKKHAAIGVGFSGWLLRLTKTNLADMELTVQLYGKYRLDDLVVYSLAPLEKRLTPPLTAAYLKAMFNRGQITRFAARWEQLFPENGKTPDAELALYHAAYIAGWGPTKNAAEARQQLQLAKADPARRALAHRLQLKVSEHLAQAEPYRESLEALTNLQQDKLTDHVAFWQLLASVGRKSEAVQLIKSNHALPASGEDAVVLAKAYFDLDLPNESREVLKKYAPEYSDSEAVWLTYANLLVDQKRWEDLRLVALKLRHEDNPQRDLLGSYSYFLEGQAELGQGRKPQAQAAFEKILQQKIENKILGLVAAERLVKLGYPEIAHRVLLKLQKEMPNQPEYWFMLAKTAFEIRDPNLLVSALASAYKLRPDDFTIINNYAAALLSTRQRPEEAIQLTLRVLSRSPKLAGAKINHSLSLLQNQRTAEAQALLAEITPQQLNDAEATAYYLAYFEIYLKQRQYDSAWKASDKINPQHLLPTDIQWLEKSRQSLPPRANVKKV